jgi:hypothetical protein
MKAECNRTAQIGNKSTKEQVLLDNFLKKLHAYLYLCNDDSVLNRTDHDKSKKSLLYI